MAWRDELLPGSFRGVPFLIDAAEREGGRRTAVFEFPGRDVPYVEDLGRRGRVHSIDFYVLGADYMARRDRLLDALEQEGPGELVHPYLGRLTVQGQTYRLRESTAEGGMVRFSAQVIETAEKGRGTLPDFEVATPAAVEAAADAALEQAQADFVEAFGVGQRPAFVAEAAAARVTGLASTLSDLPGRFPAITSALYEGRAMIETLSNGASTLVRNPVDLAAEVATTLGAVAGWPRESRDALQLYRELCFFGSALQAVVGTTAARSRERANQAALVKLVRDAAAIGGARHTSSVDYPSRTEALADRETWAGLLDDRAAEAGDDLYRTLAGLRTAVVQDLTTRGARLPEVVSWTPAATLPALVLAYRLYGTADLSSRAADLVARNRIRHPGFVPGGSALEVLMGWTPGTPRSAGMRGSGVRG